MNRGPIGRRYWSSLTGTGQGPTPERNWRGQPFWRRYVASFFVLPQPARSPRQPPQPKTETAQAPDTGTVSPSQRVRSSRPFFVLPQSRLLPAPLPQPMTETAQAPETSTVSPPRRVRSPRLLRYQSAVLAGAVVLVAVVVSVTQIGGGGSGGNTSPNTSMPPIGSGTSGTTSAPPTSSTPSGSPSNARGWQGSIRVDGKGEHVTAGPSRPAGQVFGLGVSANAVLNGTGNLAPWTQDGAPTKAGCLTLLQSPAGYGETVQIGERLCMQALDGSIASATVTSDGQDSFNGFYVDLDVVVYPS